MTPQEAHEITARVRSSWPSSYMDETMMTHWDELFLPYSVTDAVKALMILQEREKKIPPMASFVDIMEGEANHRVKCPKCGIGFRTEARVQEHLENVHW